MKKANMKQPSTSRVKSSDTKEQYNYPESKFAQGSFRENAWTSRSRYSSVSEMWSDSDEHFPALGASAPLPKVNVWEERMSKQQAIQAMEPQNQYDEEAMLQQALALSILEATEEEERWKKMEDEYRMQTETLQNSTEVLEDFDALDEFRPPESKVGDSLDNPNDFQAKKHHQTNNFSKKSVSNFSQKQKIYNSEGARPKINKAIDRFGGWGLKHEKKENDSENLSNFVEEVISDRSQKKAVKSNPTPDYQNNYKSKQAKEIDTANEEDPWGISDKNEVKKSSTFQGAWDDDETLYDEKETFVDKDEEDANWKCSDSVKVEDVLPVLSPTKRINEWLSSDSLNNRKNENILSEKEASIISEKSDTNLICTLSDSDKPKSENLKDKIPPASAYVSYATDNNYVPEYASNTDNNSFDFSSKLKESGKNPWSHIDNTQDELSQNKLNSYKYDIKDKNTKDFSPFLETEPLPFMMSNSMWSDKCSTNMSDLASFSDKPALSGKDNFDENLTTIKFDGVKSGVLNPIISSSDTDLPPILPPQPPPTMAAIIENKTPLSEVPDGDCKFETPHAVPPECVPEMTVPQFPLMTNPVFNPMFLGLNPMLGCADPILMRQMLMLSNPLLASQMLAMEQHYRSLGIPLDLFSVPTSMPSIPMPGMMMGPSLLTNTFANASPNSSPLNNNEFTNITETVNNSEQNHFEKPSQPPGLDAGLAFNNISSSLENETDDPWYKSYLTNDGPPVIPPPKPPSNDVNRNNLISPPEPSTSNQSASMVYSDMLANTYVPNSASLQLAVGDNKSQKPISTIGGSITKREAPTWGDPEDDSFGTHKSWNDGWGDDDFPAKSLRNPSLQENKKTVFRQPAKQPEISRYQRNRTYN